MTPRTAIIGGGAAGFFLAIQLKEIMPEMDVTIFERSKRVLAKVEVSGGGRCNCTNTFEGIRDLSEVYPRGYRLLKRLFNTFDQHDAYRWFETHGVPLTIQDDHCVFPAAQDSHAIINCFLQQCRRLGVQIHTNCRIQQLSQLDDYDFIAVTTGGCPRAEGLEWLKSEGHEVVGPVPSLFSLSIGDASLKTLMGAVAPHAVVHIPGTRFRTQGALLVTHWGVSGPAILKLSSHAARFFNECDYHTVIQVNWTGQNDEATRDEIARLSADNRLKMLTSTPPDGLTQRLWNYILCKHLADKPTARWCDIGKKDVNKLVDALCNDPIQATGRAPFRDEFVTCGGISLKSINPTTLESRTRQGLYFAGEVLDIDGVTGGFNFQAAWTTAYVAAHSIAQKASMTTLKTSE